VCVWLYSHRGNRTSCRAGRWTGRNSSYTTAAHSTGRGHREEVREMKAEKERKKSSMWQIWTRADEIVTVKPEYGWHVWTEVVLKQKNNLLKACVTWPLRFTGCVRDRNRKQRKNGNGRNVSATRSLSHVVVVRPARDASAETRWSSGRSAASLPLFIKLRRAPGREPGVFKLHRLKTPAPWCPLGVNATK